jgi:hypothetical protein
MSLKAKMLITPRGICDKLNNGYGVVTARIKYTIYYSLVKSEQFEAYVCFNMPFLISSQIIEKNDRRAFFSSIIFLYT